MSILASRFSVAEHPQKEEGESRAKGEQTPEVTMDIRLGLTWSASFCRKEVDGRKRKRRKKRRETKHVLHLRGQGLQRASRSRKLS